jgi:hypothetical protein
MEVITAQNDLKDAANLADLETAVQNAVKQIRQCDEQIILWQNKKQSLHKEFNAKLAGLQQQIGGVVKSETPVVAKIEPKPLKNEKNLTIPELIQGFLEKNGPSRAKDIRKFLLSSGRKTNPGVALSRMVKTGGLANTERGFYRIT